MVMFLYNLCLFFYIISSGFILFVFWLVCFPSYLEENIYIKKQEEGEDIIILYYVILYCFTPQRKRNETKRNEGRKKK